MADFSVGGNYEFTGLTKLSGGLDLNSLIAQTGDLTLQSVAGKAFLLAQGKVNIGSVADAIEIGCSTGTLKLSGNAVDIDLDPASVSFVNIAAVNAKILAIGNNACVTTMAFNGLSALGTGNILLGTSSGSADYGSMSGDCGLHGTNITVKPDTAGALNLIVDGTATLNINGSGSSSGTVNLATNLISLLNVGNSGCVTKLILPTPAVSPNTQLLIDPDGTIHV